MSETNNDLTTLRLSTKQFPGRGAVDAFREIFGRTILRIDMEPVQDHPLEADMTLRAFSGFGMASGVLSPMRNHHASGLIDHDDLVLVMIRKGVGVLEQRGRSVEIGEGEVALTDNSEPGTFTGHGPTHVVNLRLNRALLAPHLADLGGALLAPVIADSPALHLLKGYAASLDDTASLTTPELRRAVATHIHDLAALAIGATKDATDIANLRGVRAARLRAIKADIAAQLSDGRLSAEAIALKHGITPRYMRMLFEAEDTSFSEFVLRQRLQRAYRMLTDPLHLGRPISSIAFDCGFSDLSYFNRTFRQRFQATPSDLRNRTVR